MVIRAGFLSIAQKLQEAADVSHKDVRARLADAVNDAHRGTGNWASYVDHTGDGETGDCIYSVNGDLRKAPYELSTVGGKLAAKLDTDDSTNVMPTTTYQEEADDDDHYTAMQESFKKENLYTELPLYERFISKGERDKADEGSFAGKGKSFPILKPSDVSAAVHAMGRAGSGNYGMAQLKANIIKIAKAKGWTSELPKAWRGDSDSRESRRKPLSSEDILRLNALKESGILTEAQVQEALAAGVVSSSVAGAVHQHRSSERSQASADSIKLFESAATLEAIKLTEAKADYEIKLIAPGAGSSAFYPAEVLKRDGPKVFTPGTHVYLNHPTAAEEAARPEGDVKNLAGVLTTGAVYHEAHAKGEGLYARMKVFQDHAQTVEEKAPHVGMSIRASGIAESGKQHQGLPILKELTGAESVDVVTRAGAGGMILTEAAKSAKEGEMTLEETQKAINDGIAKATAPLLERAIRGDAREECGKILEAVTLPAAAKARIIERCIATVPTKDGKLDTEKLREAVVREAQAEGQYLASIIGAGKVTGMGATLPFLQVTEADAKAQRKAAKRMREAEKDLDLEEADVFASLTGIAIKTREAA